MTPIEKCVLHASSHTGYDAYGAILLAAYWMALTMLW